MTDDEAYYKLQPRPRGLVERVFTTIVVYVFILNLSILFGCLTYSALKELFG